MTGLFFIFGLITFFKGRIVCGRRSTSLWTNPYYVEGEAVKKIGLIICVVDVMPILGLLLIVSMHLNPFIAFSVFMIASVVINTLLSRVPCFFLDRHDY